MGRRLLAALLLALGANAGAAQCWYYWATDCFEIRDAASRDVVHHVLLSESPRAFEAPTGQCPAVLEQHLGLDGKADALKRFNKVLGKIEGFGCKRLQELQPRVFEDGTEAYASHQKLQTERAFKKVHHIRRLPGP